MYWSRQTERSLILSFKGRSSFFLCLDHVDQLNVTSDRTPDIHSIPYTLYLKNAFMNGIPYTLFMNICFHLLILNTLYPIHEHMKNAFMNCWLDTLYLIPENAFINWIPYTLFMMVGRPDQSFQRERAAFFPPDCTSPTQFDHWWLSSVHELLCLLIWSIAIEHLHHESVCDQSQLNASMTCMLTN